LGGEVLGGGGRLKSSSSPKVVIEVRERMVDQEGVNEMFLSSYDPVGVGKKRVLMMLHKKGIIK